MLYKLRNVIMDVTIFAAFKKLTVLVLALLSVVVIANRAVWAGTTNPVKPGWKQSDSVAISVAQTETQTATNDKPAPTSESKESKSKTDEKKDSTAVKKKPLKDFQPSERIEAEQAVDFPYDI